MKYILISFLMLFLIFPVSSADLKGVWYSSSEERPITRLEKEDSGVVEAEITFPGSGLIFLERNRNTMRPKKEDFDARTLSIETKYEGDPEAEVKAVVFVKDKDGHWFQSQKIYYLKPGKWQLLSVNLVGSEKDMIPVGHKGTWSSQHSVNMYSAGVNVFSKSKQKAKFYCRNLKRYGTRNRPKLTVYDWEKPKEALLNETIESRFNLSREYFNPFDADEIKIDIEAVTPTGENIIWPAFFSHNYTRKKRFNKEIIIPVGNPYWAFRFTPQVIGTYKLRINIEDNSVEKNPVKVKTPWISLKVLPSDKKGFIRVSKKDHRYFEFCTGEFFYPIGFNIHTIRDVRSEKRLKLGYQPDKGTYSYEEFFKEMNKNGVNSAEVWMAAWSFALEWTSARINYYGMGRYNLANAWRLDKVLDSAEKHNIYIHLVLDNHGKISAHSDPEWHNSPHNKNTPFAEADGAHLNNGVEFFSNEKSWNYYKNRNRYIAARWGACKNIFGVELWSEVNLTNAHGTAYNNNSSVEWHEKAADHFSELDQGKHLITTHTCGDYNNVIKFMKYYNLDQIQYVVGDAYRGERPFVDHMKRHNDLLSHIEKPILVTEYGGTAQGNSYAKLEADLHAGMWVSLFTEQAGTPFLWWHDFIHKKGHYDHFKGFSSFFKGIDPRGKNFKNLEIPVKASNKSTDFSLSCMTAGNKNELYGWVFNKKQMVEFPQDLSKITENKDRVVFLNNMKKGTFLVDFYNTLTGDKIDSVLAYSDSLKPLKINLPPFKIDIAFKVIWQGVNSKDKNVIKSEGI
jgi:hypothetical protein